MVFVLARENPIAPKPVLGSMLIACSVLMWPMSNALTQLLEGDTIVTLIFYIIALRGVVCYGFGTALSHEEGQYIPIKQIIAHPKIKYAMVRGTAAAMSNVMLLIALLHISLTETTALLFISPFIVLLLAPFILGDRFKASSILIIAVAIVGIFLVTDPTNTPDDKLIYGLGSALLAGVFLAIFVLTAHKNENFNPYLSLRTSGICYTIWGIVGLIIANSMGFTHTYLLDFSAFSWTQILIIAGAVFLHFMGTFLGQEGFKYTPPVLAAVVVYMELLWIIVIENVMFTGIEQPSVFIGLALIGVAGIASVYFNNKTAK